MITLGMDTSADMVSAALVQDGLLLGESAARSKHKHSEVLLPMADALLRHCGLNIGGVDRIAVTNGPGSFTGVRIAAATAKGMAQAKGLPCAGVSTLHAMAALGNEALAAATGIPVFCCAMDARRAQVYAALFEAGQGMPARLSEDEALPVSELEQRLEALGRPVFFLGDGAQLCYDTMQKRPDWQLAPQAWRTQRAYGAILAAKEDDYRPAGELQVLYLRPSQAERMLNGEM